MRPYWKGYLKLALVSCPIALHAACSTAERIAFRQINKATGNRLRQQLIDEETREPVDPEHKGRGYEVAKGQYLIVEDEELEAIEIVVDLHHLLLAGLPAHFESYMPSPASPVSTGAGIPGEIVPVVWRPQTTKPYLIWSNANVSGHDGGHQRILCNARMACSVRPHSRSGNRSGDLFLRNDWGRVLLR
jgi:hypothetical protein